MRIIRMWNDSSFRDFTGCCMSWIGLTMDCGREDWHRYLIAGAALCALDNHQSFSQAVGYISPRNDRYAELALGYLDLYHRAQSFDNKIDPSPARPAAAIVALQIIRVECSDVERLTPKMHILGTRLVRILTWAAEKTHKNPVHFRPLALEIFTLIGGMWFDPWVDEISSEDKARFIDALGNVLDAPNLTFGNRDPLTPWHPSRGIGNYQEMFEGRTASFVCRSSHVYLIPLLFGLCSSKSWQGYLKKLTFDFVAHKTFKSGCWAIWLRHTWKTIARDSRLDIRLIAIKLKELECYDALALVIRSIWLCPDPDMLPPPHWEWVDQETLRLFGMRRGPDWRPLEGCYPILSQSYVEPFSGDQCNPPGGAARYIFEYEGEPDGPIREQIELGGQLCTYYHKFEVERPPDWMTRQARTTERLRQVLEPEIELEERRVLQKCGENKVQAEEVPSTLSRSAKNLYFVCDYPC